MTESDMRLSICIPTYNFGAFIGETLESIVAQIDDTVEIIVLDSASTDDTEAVMAGWTVREPRIRYHRANAKGGIDRDMVAVTKFARGEYLWLFSADDLIRPGAIGEIHRLLDTGTDICLLKHNLCTVDMRVFRPEHPVLAGGSRRYDIHDEPSRIAYFSRARTTEAFFSFMGSLIVKRSIWELNADSDLFMGSCWAHAARLLETMRDRGLSIDYFDCVLIDKRGDNDSFSGSGVVARYALAIEGYQAIADTLFGAASQEAFHVRRVLRVEFGLGKFIYGKLVCVRDPAREDRQRLDSMLASLYRDPGTGAIVRAGYALVPTWLTALAWRARCWFKDAISRPRQ